MLLKIKTRAYINISKRSLCPDLHNLRNPQDYLGGRSWKNVKLEAHLKKYETEDYEKDEILE